MIPPRICLSLYGATDEICDSIGSATGADLFEIRLDLSAELDLSKIRNATKKPLLFASHTAPDLLARAVPFADYLDVARVSPPPAWKGITIVSEHGNDGDPIRLWKQLSGDHLTKLVLNTAEYSTIASLIELNRSHAPNALCFAMGETGAFSRMLSIFRGAPWIYTSQPGRATGDGQFTLQDLTLCTVSAALKTSPRFLESQETLWLTAFPPHFTTANLRKNICHGSICRFLVKR